MGIISRMYIVQRHYNRYRNSTSTLGKQKAEAKLSKALAVEACQKAKTSCDSAADHMLSRVFVPAALIERFAVSCAAPWIRVGAATPLRSWQRSDHLQTRSMNGSLSRYLLAVSMLRYTATKKNHFSTFQRFWSRRCTLPRS